MPRKHGCQAPWRPAQVLSLLVWFSTVAGFYALFLPVLPSVMWQATTGVLYSGAAAVIFCTYFVVSLTDPADDTTDGPLYCDYCQAFVQRGSRHCKECQKCVLGFDHHCKWINNCIGCKNYRSFMVLLTAMCGLLAVQLAVGIDDLLKCFKAADVMDARIQAAYPVPISLSSYIGALCAYLAVVLLALYGLGDLWLLHLVLIARGLTTYDYIMANHDAAVAAAAVTPGGPQDGPQQQQEQQQPSLLSRSWRRLRVLGPRSSRVRDSSVLFDAAPHSTGSTGSSSSNRGSLNGGSNSVSAAAGVSNGGVSSSAGISNRKAELRLLIAPQESSRKQQQQQQNMRKHRVSLTPCQACLTPQSAVEAQKHAVAYQACSLQSLKPESLPALSPRLPAGVEGTSAAAAAAAAAVAAGGGRGIAGGAAAFDESAAAAAAGATAAAGSAMHAVQQQQQQGSLQHQKGSEQLLLLQHQQQGQGLGQQQQQLLPHMQDALRGPLWPALQQSQSRLDPAAAAAAAVIATTSSSGGSNGGSMNGSTQQQQQPPGQWQAGLQLLQQLSKRRSKVSVEAAVTTLGPSEAAVVASAAAAGAAAAPASPRGVLRHTTSTAGSSSSNSSSGGQSTDRSLSSSHRPSVRFAAELE